MELANLIFTIMGISAGLSAVAGIYVLESFFRNKLKDLFDDTSYFIFFFLVCGYFLYALGELAFYLSDYFAEQSYAIGIYDVYWSAGGFLILISFFALALMQANRSNSQSKLLYLFIIAVVLATISFVLVHQQGQGLFAYFYPLISSLIVSFSLGSFFFARSLGNLARPLQLFFLASSLIFVGDLIFSSGNTQVMSGTMGVVVDVVYLGGYLISLMAFLMFRSRMHTLKQ